MSAILKLFDIALLGNQNYAGVFRARGTLDLVLEVLLEHSLPPTFDCPRSLRHLFLLLFFSFPLAPSPPPTITRMMPDSSPKGTAMEEPTEFIKLG